MSELSEEAKMYAKGLARIAVEHPSVLQFVMQLINAQACPVCGFIHTHCKCSQDIKELPIPHSYAGFKAQFYSVQGRMPTEQEVYSGGMSAGRDLWGSKTKEEDSTILGKLV